MSILDEINEDWQVNGLSPTWAKLQQAKQEQAALIAERDALKAELDRIKALKPTHWQVTQGARSFVMTAAEFNMSTFDYGSFVALYALGSKA